MDYEKTRVSPALRVILVGAGNMGRAWLHALLREAEVEVVGVVDLDLKMAAEALSREGVEGVPVFGSLSQMIENVSANAVVNVTIPAAHHAVNTIALAAGLDVLCEKPIAPTVAEAMVTAAAAELSGHLLMVSQSRRFLPGLTALKTQLPVIGELGIITTAFAKAPRFGGFREEMAHVLLVDMAIHAFDVARYLTGSVPVAVYCEEFNPSWSWYDGDAAATAVFTFDGGVQYSYTGSWCSDGLETSWNGSWRLSGSQGSVIWDGETAPVVQLRDEPPRMIHLGEDTGEEIVGSLREFKDMLRGGQASDSEIHRNILSLVMVEAAIQSSTTGTKVFIRDVLEEAYSSALTSVESVELTQQLRSWRSALQGLGLT